MADTLTPAERSERMSRVRGRGNKSTELRMVRLFRSARLVGWRRGLRLPGKPDFVFQQAKTVIFVDGCFWHGCPRHRRVPKSRVRFWFAKLASNVRRDRMVTRMLRASGWTVFRVWECDLAPKKQARLLTRLRKTLHGNIC